MNYGEPPEGHPDYYDYYDYNYTGDWGWDTDPRVKVPGFGFVPAKVDAKLNAMTQARDFIWNDCQQSPYISTKTNRLYLVIFLTKNFTIMIRKQKVFLKKDYI